MDITLLSLMLLGGQILISVIFFILFLKAGARTQEHEQRFEREEKIRVTQLQSQLDSLKGGLKSVKERASETPREVGSLEKKDTELEVQLKDMLYQRKTLEEDLKKASEELRSTAEENQTLNANLRKAEAERERLEEAMRKEAHRLPRFPQSDAEVQEVQKEGVKKKSQVPPEGVRKNKKIGEILFEQNFISKQTLDKALAYQQKYGGNLAQYLLAYGYIDEARLAQCLCTQFAIPYLPLGAYRIPDEIIHMVTPDLAEKYLLLPVDRFGNFLTVVMADPLDLKAIEEVEAATGCTVRPFVGILSEIIDALRSYYKIIIREKRVPSMMPLFVDTEAYRGQERRQWVRFDTEIDVSFPVGDSYKKSKTINVSRIGFLLRSDSPLPIGSIVPLEIELPKELGLTPYTAVVQVVRVIPLANKNFGIGVKIIKMSEQELSGLIEYASTHERASSG